MSPPQISWALFMPLALVLGGCGTRTPEMQDYWEGSNAALIQVATLKTHVTCEVLTAVSNLLGENMEENIERAKHPGLKQVKLDEIKSWFAEILLTLTVEEKGQFNPNIAFNNVYANAVDRFKSGPVNTGQTASIGLAGAFSADATRKITIAYGIDLNDYFGSRPKIDLKPLLKGNRPCFKPGAAFTDGDLKFYSTLRNALAPASLDQDISSNYLEELRIAEKANKKDVISHQITFVVGYGASLVPSIKLVDFNATAGSSPFAGAQRTNTQDVLITLGPKVDGQLSPLALSTIESAQISTGTANVVRSAQ